MKVDIKAMHPFSHGSLMAEENGVYPINKADADELVKVGLAEIVTAPELPLQTGVTDSPAPVVEDDLDDLVGGEKMDAPPLNKMEPAPATKGKKK